VASHSMEAASSALPSLSDAAAAATDAGGAISGRREGSGEQEGQGKGYERGGEPVPMVTDENSGREQSLNGNGNGNGNTDDGDGFGGLSLDGRCGDDVLLDEGRQLVAVRPISDGGDEGEGPEASAPESSGDARKMTAEEREAAAAAAAAEEEVNPKP